MGNLTTDFKRQNPLISDDEMGKLCWIWVSLILAFQCWTEPGNYIRFLFVVKIWLLVRVKGSVRCKSQEYLIQLKYYFWTWFQTKLSYISAVPRQKSKKHLLKSRVYFILSPNIVFAKDCDSNSNKTRIFSFAFKGRNFYLCSLAKKYTITSLRIWKASVTHFLLR